MLEEIRNDLARYRHVYFGEYSATRQTLGSLVWTLHYKGAAVGIRTNAIAERIIAVGDTNYYGVA